MQQSDQDLATIEHEVEEPSLVEELRQLAEEGRVLAQAEFAFQKSRAAYAGAESKTISLLLAFAAVLVFFSLMALVMGTVIALGPLLGPWGAMGAVTLLLLLIAATCAFSARTRVTRMMAILSDEKNAG